MDGTKRLEWHLNCNIVTACPNCATNGPKRAMVRVQTVAPEVAENAILLHCEHCGCGFFQQAKSVDYALEPVGGGAALAFYLQQGAGLWSIDAALLRLGLPPGIALLEVGCGFGFGLDFARRALGWQVQGMDPSPFAQAGKNLLDLPIEHRHLIAGGACGGPYDVILASELLEHVPDPPALLATLKSALQPGGTLVLTTPNFEAVTPETSPGLLIPLLSVGYHMVLQSRESLRSILQQAGFSTIEIDIAGPQLVARATDGSAKWLPQPPDRTVYRHYLDTALATTTVDGDLWFGFAARAFREAVNERDADKAEHIFIELSNACQRRYGFDLEHGPELPPLSLEALVAREPVCLGPLLLYRGLQRLGAGESRVGLTALFQRSVAASKRLRQALQAIGTDDGDAEDVAWVAEAEAVLCEASRGATDLVAQLGRLGRAPGDGPHADRAGIVRRRCFVEVVNAGRYEQALSLADAVPALERLPAPEATALPDDQLDALFCGAVLDLQHPDGDLERALNRARALREHCAQALTAGPVGHSPTVLIWPALRLEVLALEKLGHPEEASRVRVTQRPLLERLPGAGSPPADLATAPSAGHG